MTYEEISKEYMEIHSKTELFKGELIQEITKLVDKSCGIDNPYNKVITFDKFKHGIDGAFTYFRIIRRKGIVCISASVHCDDLAKNIFTLSLSEIKFIYEVLYHGFFDVS